MAPQIVNFVDAKLPSPPIETFREVQDPAKLYVANQDDKSESNGNDALVVILSGVYAKLIVVMGICFPLGKVISSKIPTSYYEIFYLYLYIGSMGFMVFVYMFLLRREKDSHKISKLSALVHMFLKTMDTVPRRNSSFGVSSSDPTKNKVDSMTHCVSFYVRLSAVAFGIGSMVFSGLEFGQFFELSSDSKCYNILFGLKPFTRMMFTFVQTYFIFINSTMIINKYKTISRFGLMHMVATNICIWFHVLVQETMHGFLTSSQINATTHSKFENSWYMSHECRRSSIMGKLVQDASQFLFPCSIEHSLIAAAIIYLMWRNVGKDMNPTKDRKSSLPAKKHYYQVDCTKANKGLFTGIFVLALSIISIILFFVFISQEETRALAVLEARITELMLYIMTTLVVAVAMYQMHELKYSPTLNPELDNYLLVVGQSGLYLFNIFSLVSAIFADNDKMCLVLMSSVACLVQSTLQTVFIFDASKRRAMNSEQMDRKPGREMVTFLLLCNFAMWAINTLETQRADSNPVQLNFYSFMNWTVILYVTTPLAIYFRFHSTVCLCDIWKKCYKVKHEYA